MKKTVTIEFDASKGSSVPTGAEIEIDLVELPAFDELADGVYEVTVVDGVATWSLSPLPAAPADDGLTYHLTVVDGVYTWVQVV